MSYYSDHFKTFFQTCYISWWKKFFFSHISVLVCLWFTHGSAHGLILPLCSEMTLGRAKGKICGDRIEPRSTAYKTNVLPAMLFLQLQILSNSKFYNIYFLWIYNDVKIENRNIKGNYFQNCFSLIGLCSSSFWFIVDLKYLTYTESN